MNPPLTSVEMRIEPVVKRKRVFLTGATSGIVRRLVTQLDTNRYELLGLTRSGQSADGAVRAVQGDLLEQHSWQKHLDGVDIVIHAAAITHSRDENLYDRVNRQGTIKLIDAANRYNVRRFVFISSRVAVENSGAYGESKLAAEQYVRASFDDHLIVRPAEVFGVARGEGVEKLIHDAINNRIHLYPSGVRSPLRPIHVDDLVSAILLHWDQDVPDHRTLTVAGSEAYTLQSLIRAVGEWTGSPRLLIPLPRVAIATISWLTGVLGIGWGPVPDQVPRLYALKLDEPESELSITVPLRQYVIAHRQKD